MNCDRTEFDTGIEENMSHGLYTYSCIHVFKKKKKRKKRKKKRFLSLTNVIQNLVLSY